MPTEQIAAPAQVERKPLDEEIDVYGLTHAGKTRPDNQDHFLICALRKQMVVQQTSLPFPERLGWGGRTTRLPRDGSRWRGGRSEG